jgi:hypothetical protein
LLKPSKNVGGGYLELVLNSIKAPFLYMTPKHAIFQICTNFLASLLTVVAFALLNISIHRGTEADSVKAIILRTHMANKRTLASSFIYAHFKVQNGIV